MAAQLPTIPRLVFTLVEPISLLSGALPALVSPDWFVREQLATTSKSSAAEAAAASAAAAAAAVSVSSDNARVVAQQLGNAYGLLFMVGVAVLYTSTERQVVRNYLVALLLADIGHVGLTLASLGPERFSVVAWNAMTWGNIGFTTFLALTRTAYFLGLFGPDKPVPVPAPKKKS